MAMEEEALNYLRSHKEKDPDQEKRRIKKLEERLAAHQARRASIAAIGVQDPVKVIKDTEGWLIVDGRHRAADAALAGRDFPAVEVHTEDMLAIIETSYQHARQRSKGAKAWLAVCLYPHIAFTATGRPQTKNIPIPVGITRAELAEQSGVSPDLIDQACALYKLRELFVDAGNPAEAARIDASIAAGNGLGAIKAGLEGKSSLPTSEDGIPTRNDPTLKGATRTIATLKTQLTYIDAWGDAGKAAALAQLGDWFRTDDAARALFIKALDVAAGPRPTPAEMMASSKSD